MKASICAYYLYTVIIDDLEDARFTKSASAQIKGLLERESYSAVSKSDIPYGSIILKSRVRNTIYADQYCSMKYKIHLVIQGHRYRKGINCNRSTYGIKSIYYANFIAQLRVCIRIVGQVCSPSMYQVRIRPRKAVLCQTSKKALLNGYNQAT